MQTRSFTFTHIFSIYNTHQYFLWILVITWYHFLLAQSSPFIISNREDLPTVDSLFLFIWECLIPASFLKDSFVGYKILCSIFSLSALWISFHCFLASTIAYEPLPYYLLIFNTICFAPFKILSNSSLIMIYLDVVLFVCSYLVFLEL